MAKESLTFALMGNQNSGKTTLFNRLTGSQLHVSNFPGVTVERKSGHLREYPDSEIVDLPGIYSLSPYSPEEVISRNFLIKETPDCILNIVDATSLERGLYLTLQLIELDIPMTLALNMIDEMSALGRQVDVDKLSEELGIPVVAISASQNKGVSEYMRVSMETAVNKTKPLKSDLCSGPVHRAIHSIAAMIEDHAEEVGVTPRFAATKLIEGDELFVPELGLNQNELEAVEHIVVEMERDTKTDRLAALADMRYAFISEVESRVLRSKYASYEEAPSATLTLDRILLHKWFGIPIFLAVMVAVSWISFGPFGQFLNDTFADAITRLGEYVGTAMAQAELNPIIQSLVVDGIFSGVEASSPFADDSCSLFPSVLLKLRVTWRVAFIMDRLMRKIGLSGASIVPLLLGFGCSVPAVMAREHFHLTRPDADRAPCAIHELLGKSSRLRSDRCSDLPAPRSARDLWTISARNRSLCHHGAVSAAYRVSRRSFSFPARAAALPIPVAGVTVETCQTPCKRVYGERSPSSCSSHSSYGCSKQRFPLLPRRLSRIEHAFRHRRQDRSLFVPLGFSSTPTVSALLAGFSAKETIISTLTVATSGSGMPLTDALHQLLTAPARSLSSSLSFLYALCRCRRRYAPRTWHPWRALPDFAFQTFFAWIVSFIVYRLALLASHSITLFFLSLIAFCSHIRRS